MKTVREDSVALSAALRDTLAGALIGLARATEGNDHMLSASTAATAAAGVRAMVNWETANPAALEELINRVRQEKRKLVPECFRCAASCGRTDDYDMGRLQGAGEAVRGLKFLLLYTMEDVASRAEEEAEAALLLYKVLMVIGLEDWDTEDLLPIVLEVARANKQYGKDAGEEPFLTAAGAALPHLKLLLELTARMGVRICARCEFSREELQNLEAYPHFRALPPESA